VGERRLRFKKSSKHQISCRAEQQGAALKFLEKANGSFAEALELKDVVPLLEAMEMYEGIVQLCVSKADAIVCSFPVTLPPLAPYLAS
jgi:hypothetical protein